MPPALGGERYAAGGGGAAVPAGSKESSLQGARGADTARAMHLIAAYQRRGHERADLDPLRLKGDLAPLADLDPATYGFEPGDYDRELRLTTATGSAVAGLLGNADFETILATKFNTAKRFGLEGCESMIPGMKIMVDAATLCGVSDVIIGMPHRGRLNVLCNVVRKPIEVIFREFMGTAQSDDDAGAGDWSSSGDVKYHLGTSYDRAYPDGRRVQVELLPNPSHLEAVNPLVIGKARARMDMKGDPNGDTVLPVIIGQDKRATFPTSKAHISVVFHSFRLILDERSSLGTVSTRGCFFRNARARNTHVEATLNHPRAAQVIIHGDAAFAGQGVVYETMQMVNLEAYKTGGTIHVICNNQVGFTCLPEQGRSTMYSSDLGKAFGCPIFHVNADDPEAVCRVFETAVAWRHEFKTDVIIDLIGYRKFGHNEIDEPTFTQPTMYQVVKKHPSVLTKYVADVQVTEPKLSPEDVGAIVGSVEQVYAEAFDNKDAFKWDRDVWGQNWQEMVSPLSGFSLHRRLKGILAKKAEAVASGEGVDWAQGEALAFGTLLDEGTPVRFTGQDVERGTFTHRHAVVHDQKDGATHTFLNAIAPDQAAKLDIHNSFLSEYGVLGFELGYSFETPDVLCVWEAQFGDFVNGAQIIIDQFLSSGEAKWMRQSGLNSDEDPDVIPPDLHTMEGQVRQVQLNNWQIINPTTPANYFHALRRQQHRDFRKPLIVASTKALLRHKLAVSNVDEFLTGSRFRRTYGEMHDDEVVADADVRRVVLCSGKIYYELLEARRKAEGPSDVALVRVEQISPFPFDQVANYATKYANAELVWTQEEPKNQGAWYYVRDRIMTATRVLNGVEQRPGYCGRATMASTAEGYGAVHDAQQKAIIDTALSEDLSAFPFGLLSEKEIERAA
ncbi:oxoglutarate dehydrogenase [Aureococcus anophagefferens]|nr:oxoglutarate dehydrogenase [Aureococcus anophagefferens]